MTQCTRCRKENVEVHTCTPLPTTPVGGTVEGDWIEKVQRDMGEMKFHCDSRYADWDTLMAGVRQSIEKHMPTPKSQEAVMEPSSLQNIDVEKVVDLFNPIYVDVLDYIESKGYKLEGSYLYHVLMGDKLREILSALPIAGKKFTAEYIKKYVNQSPRDSFDAGKVVGIEEFLKDHNMLAD